MDTKVFFVFAFLCSIASVTTQEEENDAICWTVDRPFLDMYVLNCHYFGNEIFAALDKLASNPSRKTINQLGEFFRPMENLPTPDDLSAQGVDEMGIVEYYTVMAELQSLRSLTDAGTQVKIVIPFAHMRDYSPRSLLGTVDLKHIGAIAREIHDELAADGIRDGPSLKRLMESLRRISLGVSDMKAYTFTTEETSPRELSRPEVLSLIQVDGNEFKEGLKMGLLINEANSTIGRAPDNLLIAVNAWRITSWDPNRIREGLISSFFAFLKSTPISHSNFKQLKDLLTNNVIPLYETDFRLIRGGQQNDQFLAGEEDISSEVWSIQTSWDRGDLNTMGYHEGFLLTTVQPQFDPKQFALGVMEGFGIVLPCTGNVSALDPLIMDVMHALLEHHSWDVGTDRVKNALRAFSIGVEEVIIPATLRQCNATAFLADLRLLQQAAETLQNPTSFVCHIAGELLVNGHNIFSEVMSGAKAFKAGRDEVSGVCFGKALRMLLVGEETEEAATVANSYESEAVRLVAEKSERDPRLAQYPVVDAEDVILGNIYLFGVIVMAAAIVAFSALCCVRSVRFEMWRKMHHQGDPLGAQTVLLKDSPPQDLSNV